MKIDREQVYNKYNGLCAYCGNPIEIKSMQVDHIFPQARKHRLKSNVMREIENIEFTDIDDIRNLNPSCRRCNHYKRALDVSEFRKLLLSLHERIQKQYIDKVAIDYGIITVKPFDGIFYFEKERETLIAFRGPINNMTEKWVK